METGPLSEPVPENLLCPKSKPKKTTLPMRRPARMEPPDHGKQTAPRARKALRIVQHAQSKCPSAMTIPANQHKLAFLFYSILSTLSISHIKNSLNCAPVARPEAAVRSPKSKKKRPFATFFRWKKHLSPLEFLPDPRTPLPDGPGSVQALRRRGGKPNKNATLSGRNGSRLNIRNQVG